MNEDVEKTRIVDHLSEALKGAQSMNENLLEYLIAAALSEARQALYGQKATDVGSQVPRSIEIKQKRSQ